MMRGVYAFICIACDHRSALHGMFERGDPSLYRCRLCGCEITENAPTRSLNKKDYDIYLLSHPEDPQSSLAANPLPDPRLETVNRLEVIDGTRSGQGRAFSKWENFNFDVQFDLQDGGRTLKVFLIDAADQVGEPG